MTGIRFQPSIPKPKESQPLAPGLKRVDSLPARLASHAFQPAEVNPERKPISRLKPDTRPPVKFQTDGQIHEGSLKKLEALETKSATADHLLPIIEGDAEFMSIITSRHKNFARYTPERKFRTVGLLLRHPRFLAELARVRNEVNSIPSSATSSRTMTRGEQRFLTHAFQRMQEEYRQKQCEFHIHGEMAVTGDKYGRIHNVDYIPKGSAKVMVYRGDKYFLHNHVPFDILAGSSASEEDHRAAAIVHRHQDNKTVAFVTNGKDVLHIPPDSTELVKLLPDPEWEKRYGKFPVAFTVPDPQRPPYPFSNHEAPAAFKPWNPLDRKPAPTAPPSAS